MTEWAVLYDNPAGRVLALRAQRDGDHWVSRVHLDTEGAGVVWRDDDGEVLGYDLPLGPDLHPQGGRPDLPVPPPLLSMQHPEARYVWWLPVGPAEPVAGARRYDVRDLVRAYLELDRWRDAPRRRWARRRYEALTRGLGIVGRGPADQPADPATAVEDFFRRVVEQHDALQSPFAALLEAPEAVVEAYQRHREEVDRSLGGAREALVSVLAVLLEAGWHVEPGATVAHAQLAEWGWDLDERRPDPVLDDD
jgi:hypothetical protein